MADLSSVKFHFVQDGNTNGSTEEIEEIEITMEAPIYITKEEGSFIVIKTSTGWSIDSPEEFNELLKGCCESTMLIARKNNFFREYSWI